MSDKSKLCCVCGNDADGLAGFEGWTPEMECPCCQTCSGERFDKWVAESVKILSESRISFPSLGNLALYRRELEAALRSDSRMADGICPNGCARMVRFEEGDDHTRKCPSCGFVGWQNTPIEFPYEAVT